jgi:hypothetical protein
MLIHITFFKDEQAFTLMEQTVSLRELADTIAATEAPTKSLLPWLKFARFGDERSAKHCLRHDKNLLAITGIEGEHDKGQMGFDDAMNRLESAGILAVGYTTASHTPEAPRWRALCPLSAEQPPEQRAIYVSWLNGVLAGVLSRESFNLSQAYYFGHTHDAQSPRVRLVDGKPIDLLPHLANGARGKPAFDGTSNRTGGGESSRGGCDPEACLEAIRTGTSYHGATVSLAGLRARELVAIEDCIAELAAAYRVVDDKDDRWYARWGVLERNVKDIYTREEQAAREREAAPPRLYTGPVGRDRLPSAIAKAVATACRIIAETPEGSRNSVFRKQAWGVVKNCIDDGNREDILYKLALAGRTAGLDEDEMKRSLDAALKSGACSGPGGSCSGSVADFVADKGYKDQRCSGVADLRRAVQGTRP